MAEAATRFVKSAKDDPQTPPSETEIAEWENVQGKKLPGDYRAFMLKYNGGLIFPEYFPTNYPEDHEFYDEMDDVMQFDYVYPWEMFVEKNGFDQDWNKTEFVEFGMSVPGEMLLRTAEPGYGSVHLWWRNNLPWDEPGEEVVTGNVAPSFRAFVMDVLHKVEGGSSRWHSPKTFENAQKIEF